MKSEGGLGWSEGEVGGVWCEGVLAGGFLSLVFGLDRSDTK